MLKHTNSNINLIDHLLKTGAVCMGEVHNDTKARKDLLALLQKGSIKNLFLEIPACGDEVQGFFADPSRKLDGSEPVAVNNYINTMIGISTQDNKEISWLTIIKCAKDNGVAVYCHDLPIVDNFSRSKSDKLNYLFSAGDGKKYSINPTRYFNKLLKHCKMKHHRQIMNYLLKSYATETGMKIRNFYSAQLLILYTNNLSAEEMKGSVIYGGLNHFIGPMIDSHHYSLLALCNISDERFLNYDTTVNKKRVANDINVVSHSAENIVNSTNYSHSIFSQNKEKSAIKNDSDIMYESDIPHVKSVKKD